MKKVVSVSLGSSRRDHDAAASFLGLEFRIRRVGTDGSFRRAVELLQELDGTVDAIGLGGVDVYLYSPGQRYALRDGLRLMQAVKATPVVDGSGLKNTLERETIRYLLEEDILPLQDRRVLLVCGMDRFGMAQALEQAGARLVYGDMIFSLGIDKPIRSLEELEHYAEKLLPEVCKLPISLLYPVGKQQREIQPNALTRPYYEAAEIIAGDFHFIRRHMPGRLEGKTILTNTVTDSDVEELRMRGVEWLITTTPELQGRSFGTNVMEAVLLAILGKRWEEVVAEDYLGLIRELGMKPRTLRLN
ncbi:MAG: quinate 5-dehydrogenase [Armatimonadetes bacterium]|nr:quinate 5-dehydrogenase [Armatimonadota bacterium]